MESEESRERNLLRDLRRRAGISQNEMARRLRCTQSKISKCEAACSGNVTLNEVRAYVGVSEERIGIEFEAKGMRVFYLGAEEGRPSNGSGNGKHNNLKSASPREWPAREENARLASELAQAALDHQALGSQIASLQGSNGALERRLAQAQIELDGLSSTVAELEIMVQELKAAKTQSEATIEGLSEELAAEKQCKEKRDSSLVQALATERECSAFWQKRALQVEREFRLAWDWLHSGQRERIRQSLLTDEQRNLRAGLIHAGARNIPPLPLPLALQQAPA